jgi:hypothetical protein
LQTVLSVSPQWIVIFCNRFLAGSLCGPTHLPSCHFHYNT